MTRNHFPLGLSSPPNPHQPQLSTFLSAFLFSKFLLSTYLGFTASIQWLIQMKRFNVSSQKNSPRHKSHKGMFVTASVPISILDSDKIPWKGEIGEKMGLFQIAIPGCNPLLLISKLCKNFKQLVSSHSPSRSQKKQCIHSPLSLCLDLARHSSGCHAWGRVLPTVGCIFSYQLA